MHFIYSAAGFDAIHCTTHLLLFSQPRPKSVFRLADCIVSCVRTCPLQINTDLEFYS